MKNDNAFHCLPRFFLTACFIIISSSVNAQWQGEDIPSPDVWSFIKYGNHQPGLYTGAVSVSVPIYTYSDKDFTLPLSVDYASDGYLPNQQTGILGMGWTLNIGGCITREVREIADERELTDGILASGYLKYFKGGTTPDWESVINDNHSAPHSIYVLKIGDEPVETQSDIYHFNFLDHSGTFCLGPAGDIYVYNTSHPHGEYKIDMSQLRALGGVIKITTGDGYKYTFGGSSNGHLSLDRFVQTGYEFHESFPKADYNLSWMLTKIEAPNNRTVEFKYSTAKPYEVCMPRAFGEDVFEVYRTQGGFLDGGYINASIGNVEREIIYGARYGIRLEEITIDDKVSVKFDYLDDKKKEKKLNNNGLNTKPKEMANIGALWHIIVTAVHDSDTLRNCSFTYYSNRTENSNPVTFLRKLQIDGEQPYVFEYYDEDGIFPYHGTTGIDHWGYYNTNNIHDPYVLIPNLEYDSKSNEKIVSTSNKREPKFLGARMGMLRTITYPTKGFSRFEYEGHEYARKIVRNDHSQGNPVLAPCNTGGYPYGDIPSYPAGGVRIKKIADYSSAQDSTYRNFHYETPDNKSSGILLHYPRYFKGVRLYFSNNITFYTDRRQRSGTDLIGFSLDKSHISYSCVKEELADGSYTEHHFSNYENMPDDFTKGLTAHLDPLGNTSTVIAPEYSENLYRQPISYHRQRGKLLERKTFDNTGNLLHKTTYHYDNNSSKSFAECLQTMWGYVYVHKTLVSDLPLAGQTDVTYFNRGADSIRTVSSYTYNRHGQLTESITEYPGMTESHGTQYVTDYVDNNPNATAAYKTMIANGFNSYQLRTKRTVNSELTEGLSNTYILSSGSPSFPLLYKVQTTELLSPVVCNDFNFDQYLVTQNIYSYDSKGYLWRVQKRDGKFTFFIHGYDGLYPVAMIENADWNQVSNIIWGTTTTTPPHLSGPLSQTQSGLLRAIPGISLTTYRYKPFVGIISIEDASGRRIDYKYDAQGRLKSVGDEKNNLIEDYEYNFKNN